MSECQDCLITLEPTLKIVDKRSGQGAERVKSGAYTLVCEHFGSVCNAAMDA